MSTKKLYTAFRTSVDIREKPDTAAAIGRRDSQLIFGEAFDADRVDKNWIFGTSLVDGYKGYVKKSEMRLMSTAATHFTDVPLTHIYPSPSFKTRPVIELSFLSRLEIDEAQQQNGFVKVSRLGWIFAQHVKQLRDMKGTDIVETAQRFVETPYLYGGRTAKGIDCSGLVQLSLLRSGLPICPRDSDQQQSAIGTALPDDAPLKRGDIVFFPGHVGIMTDDKNMINATARYMKVVVEPLEKAIKAGNKILAVKRL